MLVSARELGQPTALHDLVLSGPAPIGNGTRVLGRAYDAALEVIAGPIAESRHWARTLAVAGLSEHLTADVAQGVSGSNGAPEILDPCALESIRVRAGGAAADSWILQAARDEAGFRLRVRVDSKQLDDLEQYVLHPLLWEAGVAAAERLLATHGGPSGSQRALRARSVSAYLPGATACSIDIVRTSEGATIAWRDAHGALIADAHGLVLDGLAEVAVRLSQSRCARLIEQTLGVHIDSAEQPLIELGFSSIDRVRVAAVVAGDFGFQPKLEALLRCESLAELAELLARGPVDDDEQELVASYDRRARWPMSAAQKQVWALHALAPGTPRCNIHLRLRIRGPLDERRLEDALLRLLARHASLRVIFDESGDEPMQEALEAPRLELAHHDLSEQSVGPRDAELKRLSSLDVRTLFVLESGPLIRFALVRLAADEHALLITAHHLIIDGFGLELLVQELLALYDDPGAFGDETFGLDRVADAGEIALHEQARPRSGIYPAPDAARRLPLARDLDGRQPGRGARAEVALSDRLAASLRELARREHVSLFSVLCAAYCAVLARHAGQDEIVVGVVSASRTSVAQLRTIGTFARSVPLRAEIDRWQPLIDLARRIHARASQLATAYAESADASPFVATAVFEQWSQAELLAGGVKVSVELDSPDGAPADYCRSEIELLAADIGGELSLCLQYDCSLFRAETAAWLGEALGGLLARTVEDPTSPLERSQQATRDTALVGPHLELDGRCAHELVGQQAEATPAAIAACDASGASYTYRALIERARAVARGLRARGAGPGQCIGIVAERTAELPIAVLAVLETGAAYVPIDPAHPDERIRLALADAGVRLVISLSATERAFESSAVISLDALIEQGVGAPGSSFVPAPSDAVYVLHTSGSTGTPKGVVVEHRSLSNLLRSMADFLPAAQTGPGSVWLALSTLAFDISIIEVLFTLSRGAKVMVASAPSLLSGASEPFAFMRRLHGAITSFQCTPSLARLMLEDGDGRGLLGGLSLLILTGEAVPLWLARALAEVVPGAIYNMYGPTETTVWSSGARLARSVTWMPIGGPIANTTLRVVDEQGADIALGQSGELWIGGVGVAQGYLNRPEETAARFLQQDGQRWYRTGDLVRMRAHADAGKSPVLEWLGRLDRQVKLGGNRIELDEVEGVLMQHPFTRECAVAKAATGGQEHLVAFVVVDAPSLADAFVHDDAPTVIVSMESVEVALLGWAKQKLPVYMVPSRVVIADSLPRTGSGKTDHRALLNMLENLPEPVAALPGELPVTREEKLLAELWSDVLARADVGRYDDFFALGGTSFAAVLLASRARRRGIALAPSTVLAHATLAAQALQITAVVVKREARALVEEAQIGPLPDAPLGYAPTIPRCIVLTGATGFLGAHLLAELHASVDAEVVCLVRAPNDQVALQRLHQSVASWSLDRRVRWPLVRCIAGDLALPRFGLSAERWTFLSEQSDLVVHNAAEVNFALSYDDLKASNVRGTRNAIALAAESKRKPLHYVSTIAVTGAMEPGMHIDEETPLQRPENLIDGYSQSKWVAERLVLAAAEQGLPATCYRAGPLVSDRAPKGDAFAEAVATVARGGTSFRAGRRFISHLTRVDDTARAIVTLALDTARTSRVEHVVSPHRLALSDLLAWMREWGFAVEEISDHEWLERIDGDAWASATMFVVVQRIREGAALTPEVACEATLERLAARGFSWREVDSVLIQRLLSRLMDLARTGVD
jgi:amino acid adenylation domain-containing protein/thioester reductase-like protein